MTIERDETGTWYCVSEGGREVYVYKREGGEWFARCNDGIGWCLDWSLEVALNWAYATVSI